MLDTPNADIRATGVEHMIGNVYAAPQANLMALLDIGILKHKLPWNFVLAGAALAIVMELCSIRSLSFAIGVYLPLSTTLPIFCGGAIRGLVDRRKKKRGEAIKAGEEDLEKGNLFATGLVGGGALMGVFFAILNVPQVTVDFLKKVSIADWCQKYLGNGGYFILGIAFFVLMGWMLYRSGLKKVTTI